MLVVEGEEGKRAVREDRCKGLRPGGWAARD